MGLIEKIEDLLKIHNNTNYNELWAVCKKIVEDVVQHNKLIMSQMSNYDLHDESHSEQVISIVENLLDDKINELTCYEAILLYLSAYLHDSAMALPSWEYDLLKAVEGTEEFHNNTLTFVIANDFKRVHSYSEARKIIVENKPKLFDFNKVKTFVFSKETEEELIDSLTILMRDYESFRNGYTTELSANKNSVADYINISKLIRSDYIRTTHHIRVVDNINSLKSKIESVIDAFVANNFIQDLSSICKCHGEPMSSLFGLQLEREDWIGEKSNIQFIAMMLRLGDVIHFSSDRAPISLFSEKRITDETSFQHWNAKFQDLKFAFDKLNDIITVRYNAYCSTPEVYYFIQDYMNWVDNELENYFALKQSWEQKKIEKLASYILPINNCVDRSQLDYKKEVFIPQPNMHFVLNQSKILELLMGIQLYKDEFLCLRELYQNSLDATKCILAINKQNGIQEYLSIEFGLGEEIVAGVNRKYLYCLDHGTGMNKYIIDNFLLHIGNSYYKSKDFHRKNTGWDFEVNPTSQFGVGILSGYMLADSIGITTIYYESNEVNSFMLEGANEHFYYINAPELDKERIGKHGTIVKLYLKDKFYGINSQYIEKLPLFLGNSQSFGIEKYIDKQVLNNNLRCILSRHICASYNSIPVNVFCEDNMLHPIIQCNSILNSQNYPFIDKTDFKHFWSSIHFMGEEPNPYDEVVERLDSIENYNITVSTDNLELYSHISLPKKTMDKDDLRYYDLFHFAGRREGSILVDGVYVGANNRFDDSIEQLLDYELSHSAIINFIGKERPVLSVDRNSCVSMPEIDDEIESIKTKFVEQLISIICFHIKKEEIEINSPLFSTILNIAIVKFPAYADKILYALCETTLGDALIPRRYDLETQLTIKELMTGSCLTLKNVDFREYEEVYRRLLLGKLIDAKIIEIDSNVLVCQSSNYSDLPIERYRIHDSSWSLSSVVIRADKWDGYLKEYDLVSNLWPIINPQLFDALFDEHSIKDVSTHCKLISETGNGIQGIANLNPTLINPKYGIGQEGSTFFGKNKALLSNPDSIARSFWLFELTNHNRTKFTDKKGASLFAYIAPRDLSEQEMKMLKEYEEKEPEFVKGVKEGWSILFISNQDYVIEPGIVTKSYIVSKIPESSKTKELGITYYNTDGTKLF